MPFYEVELEKRQTVWIEIWVDEGNDPEEEARAMTAAGWAGFMAPQSGYSAVEYAVLNVTEKAEA